MYESNEVLFNTKLRGIFTNDYIYIFFISYFMHILFYCWCAVRSSDALEYHGLLLIPLLHVKEVLIMSKTATPPASETGLAKLPT